MNKTVTLLILLAIAVFSQPMAAQTETEEALFTKGINAYIQREFKDAAYNWKRVLEINPKNEKAKDYMEKAFDKYNAMQTYFYNGLNDFQVNVFSNAIKNFQETLIINPNHEKALYFLSLCYDSLSMQEKNQSISDNQSLALQLIQENDFRKAVALYKVLVMLDPGNEKLKLQLLDAEQQLKSQDLLEELRMHLESAREYSKEEKYPYSISEWSKALMIQSTNTEARLGLERDRAAQKLKERNEQVNYFISQGMDEFMNKRYPASKGLFQKALQLDPENETAKSYIKKINAILKTMQDEMLAYNESNKHLYQGILFYTNQDYFKARDEFNTALSIYEKNDKAAEYLERVKLKIEELEKLKQKAREEEIQRLLEKGITFYSMPDYQRAKVYFQQVLGMDPANEMALSYLKAIADILDLEMKSQVTVDSPYYRVYSKLVDSGTKAFNEGNMELALNYFEQILTLFPLNKNAQRNKLKITVKLDPEKFKASIEEYMRRGREFLNNGQVKAAKDQFLTVKEIMPEYPELDNLIAQCVVKPKTDVNELQRLYNSGISLYEQGKFQEAITDWRKILELDNSPDSNPFYARAYLNINKANRKLSGGQAGGGSTGSVSTGLDPETEKAVKKHYYLGIAHYTDGAYDKAIAEWQKVLQIDKNNAAALANIQKAKKKIQYAK